MAATAGHSAHLTNKMLSGNQAHFSGAAVALTAFLTCSLAAPAQQQPGACGGSSELCPVLTKVLAPRKASAEPAQITSARSTPKFRVTARDRVAFYAKNTYGVSSVLGPGVGAALTQWVTGNPREWGQRFSGYGRRFASGYARTAIANTIALPIAALDHEDPRYFPSNRHRIWPRARYALVHAFVVRNQAGGREMPAYSRIVGAYGAAFASNAWYPRSSAGPRHALYRGSTALASSMAYTVMLEFWPDVKRLMHVR